MINFMTSTSWSGELNIQADPEFCKKSYLELLVDECAISVKLCIYIFGLPRDFISSLPKSVLEKRIRLIELFCIRSWIIFYLIIKQMLVYNSGGEGSVVTTPSTILEFVHYFLGDLKICSCDNGN